MTLDSQEEYGEVERQVRSIAAEIFYIEVDPLYLFIVLNCKNTMCHFLMKELFEDDARASVLQKIASYYRKDERIESLLRQGIVAVKNMRQREEELAKFISEQEQQGSRTRLHYTAEKKAFKTLMQQIGHEDELNAALSNLSRELSNVPFHLTILRDKINAVLPKIKPPHCLFSAWFKN